MKVVAIAAAVVVVVCCGGAASLALLNDNVKNNQQPAANHSSVTNPPGASNSSVTNPSGAAQPNSGTSWTIEGKAGQAVDGHEFQFTVSKVNCGVARVGDEYTVLGVAKGQYCLVTLTVKNLSGTSALFWDDFASVNGPDGAAHQHDSSATYWVNKNQLPFFHNIRPGDSQTGILVFDIPKNVPLRNINLPDGRAGRVSIAIG